MMLCDSCFHANTCMNFCVGEGAYVMSGCQYYDNADRLRELAEADKDGRLCIMGVDLAIGSDMTVTIKPPVKSAEAALKAGDTP